MTARSRGSRALLLALALAACRTAEPAVPTLVPGISPPFVARQKVVAIHGGQRSAFDAVLQFDGTALVLLALTPMGTKAFAVQQTGADVRVQHFVDAPLPAPVEAVLRDIHRAYFDPPRSARDDGWHRVRPSRAGAPVVRERWQGGRLHARRWPGPVGRRAAGATVLRFPGGIAPGELPRRVEIDHPELDLRLEIHTLALDTPK